MTITDCTVDNPGTSTTESYIRHLAGQNEKGVQRCGRCNKVMGAEYSWPDGTAVLEEDGGYTWRVE